MRPEIRRHHISSGNHEACAHLLRKSPAVGGDEPASGSSRIKAGSKVVGVVSFNRAESKKHIGEMGCGIEVNTQTLFVVCDVPAIGCHVVPLEEDEISFEALGKLVPVMVDVVPIWSLE